MKIYKSIANIKQEINSSSFSNYQEKNTHEWKEGNVIITSDYIQAQTGKVLITTPYPVPLSWLFTQLRDHTILPELIEGNDFYEKLALAINNYQSSEAGDENPQILLLSVLKKIEDILDEYCVEVFVYGTLMAGERNHGLMKYGEFLGEDAIENAQLFNLGTYPMLVPGDGVVYGERYRIPLKTVQVLDQIDSHPTYYQRRWTHLKSGNRVLVYEGTKEKVKGYPSIPSGRWLSVSVPVQSQTNLEEKFVTSNTYKFLSYLRSLDVKLFAEGDKLRCSAPEGVLTSTLQAQIVEHKAEILTFLQKTTTPVSRWYSLVPIQTDGSRLPVFATHYINFKDLSRYLGPSQPVYALHYGMGEQADRPLSLPKIEDLAAHYILEMRSLQPEGPYFLMGLSFGGVVAYEVAQQLVAQGQQVGLLALFDSYIEKTQKLLLLGQRLSNLLRLSPTEFLEKAKFKVEKKFRRLRYGTQYLPHIYLPEPVISALKDYTPKTYSGRVLLFKARDDFSVSYSYDPPELGWRKFVDGELEIHEVPGGHISILEEPHVQVVAEKLKVYLNNWSLD